MLIATHRDHMVDFELRSNGNFIINVKGILPAAVTVEEGEDLTVFFESGVKTNTLVSIKVLDGKLHITASRPEDIQLMRQGKFPYDPPVKMKIGG